MKGRSAYRKLFLSTNLSPYLFLYLYINFLIFVPSPILLTASYIILSAHTNILLLQHQCRRILTPIHLTCTTSAQYDTFIFSFPVSFVSEVPKKGRRLHYTKSLTVTCRLDFQHSEVLSEEMRYVGLRLSNYLHCVLYFCLYCYLFTPKKKKIQLYAFPVQKSRYRKRMIKCCS